MPPNIDSVTAKIYENPLYARIALCASFRLYLKVVYFLVNQSPIIIKPFHEKIIRALENLVMGRNTERNLCINIPVGAGKSLIVEYFISWCFARNINNAFIYLSHSDTLINKLSAETKDICQSEQWMRVFNAQLSKDSRSKTNWKFHGAINRTGLMAAATGSGLTGVDAGNPNVDGFSGALIIDDPLDVGNARYEAARKECIEFYTDKLETRRRTPTTPTILIQQRLHKDDLTGFVKAARPGEWNFLTIPALTKDSDGNDVSFWPERYPVEQLKTIQETNPYLFNCQYQQEPISKGGNVIKSEWFKFYASWEDITPDRIFITADTAQKKEEHNDFSVFSSWFVYKNNLYLLDLVRGKWESPELRKTAISFWDKWKLGWNGKEPNIFYIEDKSSGTGLIQDLQRDTGIPVMGLPRVKDKLTRVEDVLPYVQCGRVFLPVDENYQFNPAFLGECEEFRRDMKHKNDDQIDCLADAINKGLSAGGADSFSNL